jgi:lysophospholipase L1-like esterase
MQSQQTGPNTYTTTIANEFRTYQSRHPILRSCSDIRLRYTHTLKAEQLAYNDIYVTAALNVFGTSARYPVTFGGQLEGRVSPGGYIDSDQLGLEFDASGAQQYLVVTTRVKALNIGDQWGTGNVTYSGDFEGRSAQNVDLTKANITVVTVSKAVNAVFNTGAVPHKLATGDKIYHTGFQAGAWVACSSAAATPWTVTVVDGFNYTIGLDTSGFAGSYSGNTGYIGGASDYNNNYAYGPTAVMGIAFPYINTSVAILGDSIGWGFGINGNNGYIQQALTAAKIPWINLAVSGDTLAAFISTAGHLLRGPYMGLASHAIFQYGTNDVAAGASAATIQAGITTLINYCLLRNIKPIPCTIPPKSASSDAWATAVNQSIPNAGQETIRTTVNDWIRANAVLLGCPAYVDDCSAIEVNSSNVLTLNGGRWLANGTANFYVDSLGVHPTNAAAVLMAATINPGAIQI